MENKQDKKVLFRVRNLKKYFPLKKKAFSRKQEYVRANESLSLDIYEGETLGLVGESGCGKSTFGRTLIQIYDQTEGTTLYYGTKLYELAPKYVEQAVRQIPKAYPAYLKAQQELDELYTKREEATSEDEIHSLEDQLMQKRREIENDYANMVRIAGGLLVSENLTGVSDALSEQYKIQQKMAKLNIELNTIEVQKQTDIIAGLTPKKDPKEDELRQQVASLERELATASTKVEAMRDELRGHENFDLYEDQKDEGIDLSKLTVDEMRELRKDMQIIFQDPYSSLDTRMTVGNIIGEGVIAHNMFKSRKAEGYNEYVTQIMEECGLAPYFIHRFPHQFSGGQRQRIGIARALAVEPKFIVCDEAVSALDVSIQSQVINLLQDLKEEKNLTYLFITHDLSVVKYISDRIAVMYLGVIVELGDSEALFQKPLHPYTQALLDAIPRTDLENNELAILEGDIPSAVRPPKGCRFHTRCRYAMDRCKTFEPELKNQGMKGHDHFVACHLMDIEPAERAAFMAERDQIELDRQKKQAEEALELRMRLQEEAVAEEVAKRK